MSMQKGDRGEGVKALQRQLDAWIKNNDTGLVGVIADGVFGSNTTVALAAYQKAIEVSPTGFADYYTLESLGIDGSMDASGATGGI